MVDVFGRLRDALADQYELIRPLGAGGMALVYLADDRKHQRQVAIKVLKPDLAATIGAERFLREIQIAAQLEHPHILTLIDSGEVDGLLYYVMPYVRGESLRERLERDPHVPLPEAVRILRDIVDALSFAHEHGLVHRDIKPDNVMIAGRHALVMDFGVAKALTDAAEQSELTVAGSVLGTPAYMSPEQASGDPDIDHRADIYAVGVVAYELLAGTPPFTGDRPQQVMSAHVIQTPGAVGTHRPDLPAALSALVMQCLDKQPAHRWQRADDILTHLDAVTGSLGTGTAVTPASAVTSLVHPRTTRRWTRATIALGGAIALGIAATVVLPRGGTDLRADRVLIASFSNETGDPSLDPVGRIVADWLARSLQQTEMVDVIDPRVGVFHTSTDPNGGDDSPQSLAQRLGAGTIVTGMYYVQGDSIRFQARVTESRSGTVLDAIGPVGGWADDALNAARPLHESVTAAIATRFSPEMTDLTGSIRPPTSYEAYRAFILGRESFIRGDPAAIRHLREALSLDSTFVPATISMAVALQLAGRRREIRALLPPLRDAEARLTDVERHLLAWLDAWERNDIPSAAEAILRANEGAPASPEIATIAGSQALYARRLREARRVFSAVEDRIGDFECCLLPRQFWSHAFQAYHVLGDHRVELDRVRRARLMFPAITQFENAELNALAALGRLDELEPGLDSLLVHPPRRGTSPGHWALGVVRELRAHDEAAAGDRVLTRVFDWVAALDSADAARPRNRQLLADLYYATGNLDSARAVFQALADEMPDRSHYLLNVGLIAARMGDLPAARAIREQLAASGGPTLHWQADFAAMLGERAEAMAFLEDAFGRGMTYGPWLHVDHYLEPLRGYPPFEELVRNVR